jgi:hypothetical protein
MKPTLRENHPVEVYQLRILLRQVSPIIWRRILVRSDSTIADLYYTIRIGMGWSDSHLHQFIIRGKKYGIAQPGGIWFSDDPHHICLNSFHFRLKERFLYEYNFYDEWHHEIRVEKYLPFDPGKPYPRCIGGGRSAPPEDCGGPWKFMALRQQYSEWYIFERLLEILEQEDGEDYSEELQTLRYWLKVSTSESVKNIMVYLTNESDKVFDSLDNWEVLPAPDVSPYGQLGGQI